MFVVKMCGSFWSLLDFTRYWATALQSVSLFCNFFWGPIPPSPTPQPPTWNVGGKLGNENILTQTHISSLFGGASLVRPQVDYLIYLCGWEEYATKTTPQTPFGIRTSNNKSTQIGNVQSEIQCKYTGPNVFIDVELTDPLSFKFEKNNWK